MVYESIKKETGGKAAWNMAANYPFYTSKIEDGLAQAG